MSTKIDLAKWAMEKALKYGASEAIACIDNQRNVEVGVRDGKLENINESIENSLSIDIYVNNKYSSHSTNDMRKTSLEKFIEEAVVGTKYLTKDPARSLPDPKLYPKKMNDLQVKDRSYEEIEPSERLETAKKIEEKARKQDTRIISSYAMYSDMNYTTAQVHSNGFVGEKEATYFVAGAEVTAKDKNSGRPEGNYYIASRFKAELLDADKIGEIAAENALRKIGQSKIKSGKYQMLILNRKLSRLLSGLIQPLKGSALYQKTTFLDGMKGKKIASDKLSIFDDPTIKKAAASRNFDSEGLAGIKRPIIENGILKNYYISDYYGKKLKMKPTSGSTSNLVFKCGKRSLDEMTKDMKNGILVYDFIGGNANPTTGDFSYGIAGMLVENGEFIKPVNEMNISGNAKELWNKLLEVGNDEYLYASWRCPSLLFDDIDFSGL